MKIILLIIFLWSPLATGQRSLSQGAFQSNVRPALTGIINDFYQMISLFPNFPKELTAIVHQVDELDEYQEGLKATCSRQLVADCREIIDKLRVKLSTISEHTQGLMSNQRPENDLFMTTLIGMRLIIQFNSQLFALKGSLDNSSFLLRARLKEKRPTYEVIKKIDELRTILSLAVVEYIPYDYKEDFRTFFFNFVHPIEMQIAKHKNYEFLNRNVNSLNFSINLLVQNLTKRNKKTPEGMAPYLSLIHNRWNSLLRYYF